MTSIGETLRRERLRRNLELAQISSELKISSRILEAIEAEKFDKLPGGVFTKSFVRQYARLLGLDEEEIASEMNRMLDPGPEVPQVAEKVEKPIPASVGFHVGRVQEWEAVGDQRFSRSSSLPALALVVLVMLVCSGVYAWWQRARHTAAPTPAPPPTAETVPAPVPQQQTAPPATAPAEPSPSPATGTAAAAQPPASNGGAQPASPGAATPNPPAAQPVTTAGAAESPVRPPAVAAQTAAAASALPPSDANAAVRVQLTADEPVWVLARVDGKYAFSGTLHPNETRTVEGTGTVVLRLGNAGGVTISLNGKPIGPVGPKGQVRMVQLTSGGFHIEAPKPSVPLDPL
jgi:cytoskeleton protein RodZ